MNRIAWLLMIALSGCVDSGCPKGSEEVDGICMEQSSPLTGDSGASDGGPDDEGSPDASSRPSEGGAGTDAPNAPDAPDASCEGAACEAPPACSADSTDPACACEAGFERSGAECTDIDECANGSAGCDPSAMCTNQPGSFTCECPPGYEGDGTTCTENPCEARVNPCEAATTACRADGSTAVCDCLEGHGRCDDDALACTTDLLTDRAHCGECEAACAGDLACTEGACEQTVTQLALGFSHSCALSRSGEVMCWGANNDDLLAREDASRPLYEPSATRLGSARMLTATAQETCMLSLANDLICWGLNTFQRIQPGAPEEGITATLAQGLGNVQQIGLGLVHACMRFDGEVYCWGGNDMFSLGRADPVLVPFAERVRVSVEPDPTQLSVGRASCVIGSDAQLSCWGGASPGLYTINDGGGEPLAAIRHVSTSGSVLLGCVALMDGRAMCWGENASGQLGNPAATEATLAHAVAINDDAGQPLSGIEQVAAGRYHACGRLTNGSVMCWGRRDRLGSGATGSNPQRFATVVRGIDDAIDIAAGDDHTCVRRRSGQVQCWGDNRFGQLGVNPSTSAGGIANAAEPVNVLSLP